MKLMALARESAEIKCSHCLEPTFIGDLEYDHIVPLALGGEHSWENLQPLCKSCHKRKTHGARHGYAGSDRHKIQKTKRLEAARLALESGEEMASKPKKKLSSRGFDKRYRKKMNGEVEKNGDAI